MSALVMSADQVAADLEYFHRDGSPNGELIRSMYRDGDFPAPIDPDQPVVRWRWARAIVESYVLGTPVPVFSRLGELRSIESGVAS